MAGWEFARPFRQKAETPMYFVTTSKPDYILFSMTPSERGAVALTEERQVHVLSRPDLKI